MTKAYVQEYQGLALTPGDTLAMPQEPALVSYVVDYTAAVASGPTYQALTKYVTIEVDSLAAVTFNGVAATANDKRLGVLNDAKLYAVPPAGKVSAITTT